MPIPDEQIIRIRIFDGIDLNVDSRVSDPTAWKKLQNLYGRVPGRLQKRPGSVVIEQEYRMFYQNFAKYAGDLSNDGTNAGAKDFTWKFLTDTYVYDSPVSEITEVANLFSFSSPNTNGKTCMLGAATVSRGENSAARYVPVVFIGGNTGKGTRLVNWLPGCTVNAYLNGNPTESGPWATNKIDFCEAPNAFSYAQAQYMKLSGNEACMAPEFISTIGTKWVDYLPSSNQTVYQNSINPGGGGRLHYAIGNPYTKTGGGNSEIADETKGERTVTSDQTEFEGAILGYVTDGWGRLSVLFDATKATCRGRSDQLPRVNSIDTQETPEIMMGPAIFHSDNFGETTWNEPQLTRFYSHVKAVHNYSGVLVLGGFTAWGIKHTGLNRAEILRVAPHCVTFSEVNTGYIGDESWIQIGANQGEPITALGNVTTLTDSEGLKAQLAIFTSRKFVIYDGVPPNIADAAGSVDFPFQQTMSFGIGCVSPKTVVSTPEGLVFLATDGGVYLIQGNKGLVPLGRAIQPYLSTLGNFALEEACAIYDKGFYKLSVYASASITEIASGGFSDQGNQWKNREPFPKDGPTDSTTEPPNVPNVAVAGSSQFWADMRDLQHGTGGPSDMGVKWSGPHIGEALTSFARLDGENDDGEILASTDRSPNIVEVSRFDQVTNYDGSNINTEAASPRMDIQDAHLDKTYYGFELGVATDKDTTSRVVINALATQGCAPISAYQQVTIHPCGTVAGNGSSEAIEETDPNGDATEPNPSGWNAEVTETTPPFTPSVPEDGDDDTSAWLDKNKALYAYYGITNLVNNPFGQIVQNAGSTPTFDVIDPNGDDSVDPSGWSLPSTISIPVTPPPAASPSQFNTNLISQGVYGSDQAFSLYERRPWQRLRGRVFQATITEKTDANLAYTDFALRLKPSNRRG